MTPPQSDRLGGKGRQQFLDLVKPADQTTFSPQERKRWIEQTYSAFVSPSQANRHYYRVFLEVLWPENSGIPGPQVSEDELRLAIDQFRRRQHRGNQPYKPYVDVFRRLRELQGEEGLVGIAKRGRVYQLVQLQIEPKKIPRIQLSDQDWVKICQQYQGRCAVCDRHESEVQLQQDHKIPRSRQGHNTLDNWQPLCRECNNFKSTACRGCDLNCQTCAWAFPEHYSPLRLSPANDAQLRQTARREGYSVNQLLNQIIQQFFA
ncbi:MAG: HNH endonuclease [Coleofasciculaceae cyanobacterium RL_1_1]|nr:HNH endonuclease [Coleofasciculaceae cyanobacterium RL_1_1]